MESAPSHVATTQGSMTTVTKAMTRRRETMNAEYTVKHVTDLIGPLISLKANIVDLSADTTDTVMYLALLGLKGKVHEMIDGISSAAAKVPDAKPDHSPDAGKMVDHVGDANKMVDAKCECGHEYRYGWAKTGLHEMCPKCHKRAHETEDRDRYSAAHPLAEPASIEDEDAAFIQASRKSRAAAISSLDADTTNTAPTSIEVKPAEPKADEVEGPARELAAAMYGDKAVSAWGEIIPPGWFAVARHVLRRERDRAIEELEWAFSDDVGNKEIQDRIAELRGQGS
jgi:hypothetical protein